MYFLESSLPDKKTVAFALTYIFGVGKNTANQICKQLGFVKNIKLNQLSNDQIDRLIDCLKSSKIDVNNDLKKLRSLQITKLIKIKSFRGVRLKNGFPARGQRTHTNAKTAKKIRRFY